MTMVIYKAPTANMLLVSVESFSFDIIDLLQCSKLPEHFMN